MKAYAGKVLMIVQNLPVPFDRRVWLEARTLTDNGYKVSVICPKSKEYSKSYEKIENIAIYRYKMPVNAEGVLSYFMEFAYAWLATALLSLKVLFREGFDVIQACNPPDTYFLLGLIYKLFGKEYIFDHHDLSPEMFMAKYNDKKNFLYKALLILEKLTIRTAKVVLVTNKSYKKTAVERGGKNPDDVFVLRTGPDLNRLHIVSTSDELKRGKKYLVCYLGEMCPQDGVDYLLHSVDHLLHTFRRDDVAVTLIGGGPAMQQLKEMSENMGLDDVVEFTGRISDAELCRYLSTADVCVDPDPYSEWANHSTMNKILEYMTFGKPIVSYDLVETYNSAKKAAVYAKPNDTIEFAEKINMLLNDKFRREQMGRYGRVRILEKLAWKHTHKSLLEAYDKVFAGTKPVVAEAKRKPASRKLLTFHHELMQKIGFSDTRQVQSRQSSEKVKDVKKISWDTNHNVEEKEKMIVSEKI